MDQIDKITFAKLSAKRVARKISISRFLDQNTIQTVYQYRDNAQTILRKAEILDQDILKIKSFQHNISYNIVCAIVFTGRFV